MRYLKSFNESTSSDVEFKDFDLWIPDAYEYIDKLSSIKSIKEPCYRSSEFMAIKNIYNNPKDLLNEINIDAVKSNLSEFYFYDDVKKFYDSYLHIRNIDLSSYSVITNILEDICDKNDCKYDLTYFSWIFNNRVLVDDLPIINEIHFTFFIYDSIAEINHSQIAIGVDKEFGMELGMRNKIFSDINEYREIMKKYSIMIYSKEYKRNIINLVISIE